MIMGTIIERINRIKSLETIAKPSHEHEKLASEIMGKLGISVDNIKILLLAYFIRFGYVPVSTESVPEATKNIGAAPWIGLAGSILDRVVKELIDAKLLGFASLDKLDNQIVLRISPSPNSGDMFVDRIFSQIWEKTEEEIDKRLKIIMSVGWTHSIMSRERLKNVIQRAPDNSIIKLMAYHGRTWSPSAIGILGFLLDIATKRANLKFQILIVDKNARGRVIEGATREEHMRATAFGIANLNRMSLESSILRRFDVRTYGRRDSDSLMRGLIVCANNAIIECYLTDWFFGRDRGFHGRELCLDVDSNLALLCLHYFDSVFSKSYPQLVASRKIKWIISTYWFRILTLAIVPIGATVCICLGINPATAIGVAAGSVLTGITEFAGKRDY